MICDIASIVFVCVTMNHLGLVSAIEDVLGYRLPIINCVKCSSFWATMIFCFNKSDFMTVLAVSFFSSYLAIWLELLEGYIDTLYLRLYGKIITTDSDDKVATGAEHGDSECPLP